MDSTPSQWPVPLSPSGQSGSPCTQLVADKERNVGNGTQQKQTKQHVVKFKVSVGINNQSSSYMKTISNTFIRQKIKIIIATVVLRCAL